MVRCTDQRPWCRAAAERGRITPSLDVYQGTQYSPGVISSPVSTAASYGPTPSNPLGIYYNTGSLTVSKALSINGTLIVNWIVDE